MRCIKLALLVLVLCAVCSALSWRAGLGAEQKGDDDICFRWGFGGIVRGDSGLEFVSITRDTTLKTGDSLKMFVELEKMCFVYLIYHSAHGELFTLFPYSMKQFATEYAIGKKYYIPQGDRWFELDQNVGSETFYLLASAQRLIELEALLDGYMSADPVQREELVRQILMEIRAKQKQHQRFTIAPERPVPIGGSLRRINRDDKAPLPDIETAAVGISADKFFSRTFTIDHR